ncbi:phage tail protein [Jatrophihabitans sp.]|uniref:phage tail protein n=1 Tax=Jatrophihabitans sp. TaxID=1932789 RepID=UPI002EF34D4F
MADPQLVQTFRFRVTMTDSSGGDPGNATLGDGQFAECSGLQLETDVREYLEGGRNDGVIRRVGRVKLAPIVLKRGMFVSTPGGTADAALWQWLIGMVQGTLPIPRYNGLIEVLDTRRTRTVASWSFDRGLPSKVAGPSLNAKTGEIAIEELHIVHEGLRMGTS